MKKYCRNYSFFFHTVWPVTVLFLFTSNLCCSLWRWEAGCMKAEILMDDDKFMWLKKMCLEVSSVPAQLWRTYTRWAMLWMKFRLFSFVVDGTLNLKILHPHSSRCGSLPGSIKMHSSSSAVVDPLPAHNKGVVVSVLNMMRCSE